MPRAVPADFYESAQEILVVTNTPLGQLVASVPRSLASRKQHQKGSQKQTEQQGISQGKMLLSHRIGGRIKKFYAPSWDEMPCCLKKKYHAHRIKGIVRQVAQDFHIYDNFWIKTMIKLSYNHDDLLIFYRT